MKVLVWSVITLGLVLWLGYILFVLLMEKLNRVFNEWLGP